MGCRALGSQFPAYFTVFFFLGKVFEQDMTVVLDYQDNASEYGLLSRKRNTKP
ncbi:hypothetical protein JCM19294_1995 [Nonlabens tegetincola]|uniref:Uncharacterized protein n=1 Tax=Nonlabens tegetincola TaxID=323273 RepID=A0A090Q2T8_9FLAO|nr:hypothetical protein JCM19294_1995 [Nonlabens tegetincola]